MKDSLPPSACMFVCEAELLFKMLSGDKKYSCILSPFIWYMALEMTRKALRRQQWRQAGKSNRKWGFLREKYPEEVKA